MKIFIIISGIVVLCLGVIVYAQFKYSWATSIYYTKIVNKIDYERRASYVNLSDVQKGVSFENLITEHYLKKAKSSEKKFLNFLYDPLAAYMHCFVGAFEYIEATKYKPTKYVKPKMYETLCIPEETGVYLHLRGVGLRATPDIDKEELHLRALDVTQGFKKETFYFVYEKWFYNPELMTQL